MDSKMIITPEKKDTACHSETRKWMIQEKSKKRRFEKTHHRYDMAREGTGKLRRWLLAGSENKRWKKKEKRKNRCETESKQQEWVHGIVFHLSYSMERIQAWI